MALQCSNANGKLVKLAKALDIPASAVKSLDIPAGHTCPAASICLAKASRDGGAITNGPAARFQCFAASSENRFPAVRAMRHRNLEALRELRTPRRIAAAIVNSLPASAQVLRSCASGDIYSRAYAEALGLAAIAMPDRVIYCYSKSWRILASVYGTGSRLTLPVNLRITASAGGKEDDIARHYGQRFAHVAASIAQAERFLRLPVDIDDTHAHGTDPGSFALLIHGSQPAGSAAARQVAALRKANR